jgi:uncharacterized phage protein (TIGR02218 family)
VRAFTTDEKTNSALEVTYRGWLLELTPVTLPVVRLTTIGADYIDTSVSPSITYLGDPGFVMGSMRATDGSDPASLDIEIPVSDDGPVTPDNVTAGMYQGASVRLAIVDYFNTDITPDIGFKWVVGETRITNDGKARFEIRDEARVNRELILKIYGPVCTANLGDARCGKDLTAFTDTVTVATVVDAYSFTVTGSARANGFFDNGAIKFTAGDNLNRAYTVRKWVLSTATVTLWEPLRAGLTIGDTATVHAGCDKTTGAAGCTKFSNIARFQGFENLPSFDVKFSYATPNAKPSPTVVTVGNSGSYNWSTGWVGTPTYNWSTGRNV